MIGSQPTSGAPMRSTNVPDSLQRGFEIEPIPPAGPDGAPQLPPMRPELPPRPRLCEAGPCRFYHRLVIQIDAEDPRSLRVGTQLPEGTPGAVTIPGGSLYQPPRGYHTAAHHYCYPSPGIEAELGSLPIVECNRWEPMDDIARRDRDAPVRRFHLSPQGQRFRADLAEWDAARKSEEDAAQEAERLIAESNKEGAPK